MAHDVFISYSHVDKATADAVCATLESRGVRCWIAPRDVLPGDEYASALVTAVRESRLLVLVFSADANRSPQVLREVERAVSRGLPILPFRIEDVTPSPAMEYYISSRHWLDALTTPLEQHLVRLAEDVKLLLSRMAPVPPSTASVQAVRPVPPVIADEPPVSARPIPPSQEPVPQLPPERSPPPQAPAPPRDIGRPVQWRVALAGVATLLMLGATPDPMAQLQAVFGWSSVHVRLVTVVHLLVLALSLGAGGLALRRFPPTGLASVAGLCLSAGLMLLGLTPSGGSMGWVLLAYGLLSAAGTGLGFIVAIATMLGWHPDRRGFIAGMATAAFATGHVVSGVFLAGLGLRGQVALGLGALVVLLLAARSLRHPEALEAGRRTPPAGALLSRQWLALWAILFLNTAASVLLRHMLTPTDDIRKGVALAYVLGCLIWPWSSDRLGGRRAMVSALALQPVLLIGGIVVLTNTFNATVLTLLYSAVILCNGGAFGLVPALVTDTFGPDNVGPVYGTILSAWCLGQLTEFAIAARPESSSSAGSWPWLSCMIIATLLGLSLRARGRPPAALEP